MAKARGKASRCWSNEEMLAFEPERKALERASKNERVAEQHFKMQRLGLRCSTMSLTAHTSRTSVNCKNRDIVSATFHTRVGICTKGTKGYVPMDPPGQKYEYKSRSSIEMGDEEYFESKGSFEFKDGSSFSALADVSEPSDVELVNKESTDSSVESIDSSVSHGSDGIEDGVENNSDGGFDHGCSDGYDDDDDDDAFIDDSTGYDDEYDDDGDGCSNGYDDSDNDDGYEYDEEEAGSDDGYDEGYDDGYDEGYDDGYDDEQSG